MSISKRTILLALMLVMSATVPARADSDNSDKSRKAVVILSTVSSRIHDTLTIHGKGFGDRPAQVWCQDYPLTVISWMDREIVVHLPDALPDGSHLLTIIRGEGQKDRAVFDMAVQGKPTSVPGQKGDPGAKGDKGDIGATGLRGDIGVAGIKGDTGATGPQGEPGPMGPMGPAGPAGPAGETGPMGAVGPQGEPGQVGAQGPAGETGPVGATGPQGAPGPQGPSGDTGATGAQGVAGPAGPAGPQGLMGFMGPQGPQGPQGPAGVSGLEVVPTNLTTATVLAYQTLAVVVNCPLNKVPVGGGFDYSNNGATAESPVLATVASFPWGNTWKVVVRLNQPTAASVTGRAYAICATRQ